MAVSLSTVPSPLIVVISKSAMAHFPRLSVGPAAAAKRKAQPLLLAIGLKQELGMKRLPTRFTSTLYCSRPFFSFFSVLSRRHFLVSY
jgi:hypothetical protein